MSWLKDISAQFPISGRFRNLLVCGGYLAMFNPSKSLGSRMLADIQADAHWAGYYPEVADAAQYGLWLASSLAVPYMAAKWAYPVVDREGHVIEKKKDPQVILGDMVFEEKELFTNIMITGAIGSGKTSSAIYPILRQLMDHYNVTDGDPTNPFQQLGGLVMDVKGDFYEALICFMHWAGRNVLDDLVVITPWAIYEFVEFVDPDTGLYWCVSARGGGDKGSNELVRLLDGHYLPDALTGESDGLNPLPVSFVTAEERVLDKPVSASNPKTNREYLLELDFHPDEDTRFLGWRRAEDGKLYRISHTDSKGNEVFMEREGNRIALDPPKRLKFNRVRGVNNGLTFNICPPSLGPTEMANRLVAMGKNASGKGDGGENAFWDDATKKHIGWVTQLFRTVNPDSEITAIDINRMTVDAPTIDREVNKLKDYIDSVEHKERATKEPGEKQTLKAELEILEDMRRYFEGEWATLDMKTKSNLISTITNVFGQFMNDARLRATFCVPSSFNLGEVMQSGKIFTLVAPEYESAARVFGTSLKMEFQALLRRRTAQAHFNKERFVLFCCDEAQNFVVCGGNDPSSGDENFMALSRQSKVANIIATQTDASIINVVGEKAADVYYAQFGTRVWYQNTDHKTNKRASEILGKVKREKVSRSGQDFQVATIFSKDGSHARGYNETINIEEKERFPPETFPNLNVHECVIYNKGKKGAKDKAVRNAVPPDPIGAPWEVGKKNAVIRWYFQAYIENQLHKTGQGYILDPRHEEKSETEIAAEKEKATVAEVNFNENVDVPTLPKKPSASEAKPGVPVDLKDIPDINSTPEPPAGMTPVDMSDMPDINADAPVAEEKGTSVTSDASEAVSEEVPKEVPKEAVASKNDDLSHLFGDSTPEASPPEQVQDKSSDLESGESLDTKSGSSIPNPGELLGLRTVRCSWEQGKALMEAEEEDKDTEAPEDEEQEDTQENEGWNTDTDVTEEFDPLKDFEDETLTDAKLLEVKQIIGGKNIMDSLKPFVTVLEGVHGLGLSFEDVQVEQFNPELFGTEGADIVGEADMYSPSKQPRPLPTQTGETPSDTLTAKHNTQPKTSADLALENFFSQDTKVEDSASEAETPKDVLGMEDAENMEDAEDMEDAETLWNQFK